MSFFKKKDWSKLNHNQASKLVLKANIELGRCKEDLRYTQALNEKLLAYVGHLERRNLISISKNIELERSSQ